jgi:outer membrane protein assembly factor BamB
MKSLCFLTVASAVTAVVGQTFAASVEDNWPQWRGPHQDGTAPKANPPVTWSETNNVKWKVKVPGEGSGTPIVWGNRIFVQTAIPTGKKVQPVAAAADAQRPTSEAEKKSGERQGPAGRGGRGFGPGGPLSEQMLRDGDQNKDEKLSRLEFSSLAESWFNKVDANKAGKLDQEKFAEGFGQIMPSPGGGPGSGGPGGPGEGRGPGRFMATGLFGVADANKDGSLTLDEFRKTFDDWFMRWDTEKSGQLDGSKLREGLNEALPRPQFGGGGLGGPGGGRGRGGFGGGGRPTEVQQFAVVCIDRETGKTLWQQIAREEVPHEGVKEGDGTFASHSGVTDGTLLIAYFGSHGVYCYDMDGNRKWGKDLGTMRIKNSFGEGNSPALYKDTLIINRDNEAGSFIVALDKKTGNELWKKDREEGTSWSTPLIVEHDGKAQAIVNATGKIRSYDLGSGEIIWECKGLTPNAIPSPVADSEKVYCMSGFQGNALLAIKLGGKGDLTGSDAIVWSYNKSTPYVPSPLLYEGKLYFLRSNNGRLSCFEAKDGKPLLEAETISEIPNVYASPIGAGGRVYLVGRNGTTVVLKNSGQLDKLAVNKLDEKIDASPLAVGKDLILRGLQHLYCIAEK